MPSSTSSSEERPGLRLTASDRPGVAQPVPERDVPDRPWRGIFLVALGLFIGLVTAWELYWRAYGVVPSIRNSDGLWATQRRQVSSHRTIIVGSSRVLFDIDLDTWARLAGERPLQLALEGTTPVPILEDLATDPDLHGRILVGVAPDLFFSGFMVRKDAIKYAKDESPSDRASQWLSSHLVEPFLAFYDPDFALPTIVQRQAWPEREGQGGTRVRKLSATTLDRNTKMWAKVENDLEYRAMARRIWAEDFEPPPPPKLAELQAGFTREIERAAKVVDKLRKRGVEVLFVRPPSNGEYLAYENRDFPRATTWDALLAKTGAKGIHFEDYPQLQGFELPEWSHLAAGEKPRFTEALYAIIKRDFWTK